jgi:adenine-specific DNA-methyltransferase
MNSYFKTIRYSGGKYKILPKIREMVNPLNIETVLDGFSGSCTVSNFFKDLKFNTTSNDLAPYSKVLAETFLLAGDNRKELNDIICHLNSLKPYHGWFSENYGGFYNNGSTVQSDGLKRPFYIEVARKLDAIRDEIDKLYDTDCIDKSVLLTALLLALDNRCNDMGHQVSYLKTWSKSSLRPLYLELPYWVPDDLSHNVYTTDVFNITDNFDLVYFDPPYGTSNPKTKTTRVRYFSYYHLWTTVVKNDRPDLFGASKRREDVSSDKIVGAISDFEHLNDDVVIESFNKLLDFNTRYTLISYSNRSKIPISELIEMINSKQNILNIMEFEYKENSQANSVINSKYKINYSEKNKEYLILSEKF